MTVVAPVSLSVTDDEPKVDQDLEDTEPAEISEDIEVEDDNDEAPEGDEA
jgi:hypothetical protein